MLPYILFNNHAEYYHDVDMVIEYYLQE